MLLPSLSAVALSLSIGLSAHAAPEPDANEWVAPADESLEDGTFGVTFLPRYGPDADPWKQSQQDRAALANAVGTMDATARATALAQLEARLTAVEAWNARLAGQLAAIAPGTAAAVRLQESIDRLSWEARTLRQQRDMLNAPVAPSTSPESPVATAPTVAPSPPQAQPSPLPAQATIDITWGPDQDVQVVGRSLRVPPGHKARNVTVVAGNLSVQGHVLGSATVLGGDILMHPGGRIDGETVTMGGNTENVAPDGSVVTVRRDTEVVLEEELRELEDLGEILREEQIGQHIEDHLERVVPSIQQPAPRTSGLLRFLGQATLFLATFGLCMLAQALLPNHIERAGDELAARPGVSFLMGFLTTLATASVAGFLFLTCVGIPLGTLLMGALGALWFLGLLALATRLEPSLGFLTDGQAQKASWLIIALLAALTPSLPWLLVPLLALTGTTGAGAWILSRLGQEPPIAA